MSKSLDLFTNAMGPAREKSRFTYLNYYGQKVDIPYIVWRVEGAGKNILIDAGCSAADYYRVIKGQTKDQFVAGGERFKDVQDVTSFEDGLAAWELKPDDIDVILLTHLHWDHIMNAGKCKNAKLVVQEAEWRVALNPHPTSTFAYASRSYYEQMRNLELVNGDVDFMDGIRLIHSPGHTPGGQSVAVQTKNGWYVIPASADQRQFLSSRGLKESDRLPDYSCRGAYQRDRSVRQQLKAAPDVRRQNPSVS